MKGHVKAHAHECTHMRAHLLRLPLHFKVRTKSTLQGPQSAASIAATPTMGDSGTVDLVVEESLTNSSSKLSLTHKIIEQHIYRIYY